MLHLAFDHKDHSEVLIRADLSRAALICGKRGSGKSYTLGVIAEELHKVDRFLIVLVDPIGVFWSMALPKTTADGSTELAEVHRPFGYAQGKLQTAAQGTERVQGNDGGRRSADGCRFAVNVLVPGDPEKLYTPQVFARMQELGVRFEQILLTPSALSAQVWCDLFDLSINEPLGICLYRAVRALQRRGKPFSLKDLMAEVEGDGKAADKTREALINRLDMASEWGLFADQPTKAWGALQEEAVNVLDLSVVDPGIHGLRDLIVDLLCRDLFRQRVRARRAEELGLLGDSRRIWLLIDEAHQFVPAGRSTLAKGTLIRWVKEGRQPGLSLVAVSQQPGALDSELLSQCDLLIAHKVTSNEDLAALSRLGQSYIQGDLKVYLKRVREPGEAVIVDDQQERLIVAQVRERHTHHSGSELPLVTSGHAGSGNSR